jgi:hypothetical protein
VREGAISTVEHRAFSVAIVGRFGILEQNPNKIIAREMDNSERIRSARGTILEKGRRGSHFCEAVGLALRKNKAKKSSLGEDGPQRIMVGQ